MTAWILILLFVVILLVIGSFVLLDARLRRLEDMSAPPRACTHPETKNVGTFGMPAYECVICHQIVELP
jgi:hypothetical protein